MRIPSHPRRQGLGFDMTPMIDVVFNLIIFFLLSSHLARQEVQMQLDLPSATTGERTNAEIRRIVLQVNPKGEVSLGGRALDAAQLATLLKRQQEADGAELEVRIRADRNVEYRYVEPILKTCAQLGIWDVSFAVVREAKQ